MVRVHHRRETPRIFSHYAAAIRAVGFEPHPNQLRPLAVGSRRRVDALMAMGWPMTYQAERLGLGRGSELREMIERPQVYRDMQQAIAALYRELADKPGPSARARSWARKHGRPGPFAWDEDTIDNPFAQPAGYERDDEQGGPHIDDVRELQAEGLDDDQIAARLRCTRDDVLRTRRSAAMRDRGGKSYPPEVVAYIQSGDAFDLTNSELSRLLGIPRTTIAAIRAAGRAA